MTMMTDLKCQRRGLSARGKSKQHFGYLVKIANFLIPLSIFG